MRTTELKKLLKQRGLAATISLVAIALLIFHALYPAFVIDAVTLALLVLAVLPWLGSSWIKSFEFLGVKVELRELTKHVHSLDDKVSRGFESQTKQQDQMLSRVTKIESLLQFSGIQLPEELEVKITEWVRAFLAYLEAGGAHFDAEPKVHVVTGTEFGQSVHYDLETNQLVVGIRMVQEDNFILRECCFCVFHGALADAGIKVAVGKLAARGRAFDVGSLIAGLGFYFVCSYKNTARFVAQGAQIMDLERPEASQWVPALALHPSPDMRTEDRLCLITAVGDRWAHVLWGLRARVGRHEMDRMILETWNELNKTEDFALDRAAFLAGLDGRLAAKNPAAAAALSELAEKLLPPAPGP